MLTYYVYADGIGFLFIFAKVFINSLFLAPSHLFGMTFFTASIIGGIYGANLEIKRMSKFEEEKKLKTFWPNSLFNFTFPPLISLFIILFSRGPSKTGRGRRGAIPTLLLGVHNFSPLPTC